VHEGVRVCALAGNLLCYNLYAPLVDRPRLRGQPEGFPNMLSRKKKLQLVAAFATLLLFAVGIGCNGFFVDPTLTGITVGPTATIQVGGTVQEGAVGTFNDGSTKTLGAGVNWNSGTPSTATVSTAGLVTGVAQGTAQITGSYKTQSNSATITVQLANIQSITVTPANQTIAQGTTEQFIAMANTASGPVDITNSATWNSSNTAAGTMNTTDGMFTAASGLTSTQITVISATSGGVVGQTNLTVQ
jgi:trimeric autotransporter adhesin